MPDSEVRLDEWPLRALEATLDIAPLAREPLEFVPPLWHWLYLLPSPRRRELGSDGHFADPSVPQGAPRERRMFAAARTEFLRPLRVGATARVTQATLRTRDTVGTSGALRIVTYEYRYWQDAQLCIREERDIVYRPALTGAAARTVDAARAADATSRANRDTDSDLAAASNSPPAGGHSHTITPDAAMLFRFSALTFNAHRIHYDQVYAQVQEGYPERVVQGPLTAILLAELLRERGISINRFEFRARRPLFVDTPIRLQATPAAQGIDLRAIAVDGVTAVEAQAFR